MLPDKLLVHAVLASLPALAAPSRPSQQPPQLHTVWCLLLKPPPQL